MNWWVGAVQGGLQMWTGEAAKREAKQAASRSARAYYDTAKEGIRRLKLEQARNMGSIEAMIGAGGLLNTGSTRRYVNTVMDEQQRQLSYQKKSARLNRDAIIKGGNAQADALYRSQLMQGVATGAGAVSNYWNNSANNAATTPTVGGGSTSNHPDNMGP